MQSERPENLDGKDCGVYGKCLTLPEAAQSLIKWRKNCLLHGVLTRPSE